ncbi:hypothetical protein MIR68_002767 [Amoeboaphelidium protococcarum]|nr:hypothetical protein MIR68_002767 [Amoeboaphelidium protococcarum]
MSALDSISKFNSLSSQVVGIDKIYKIIVYAAKLIALNSKEQGDWSLANRLSNLVTSFSDTRMVLRLFGLSYYVPIIKSYLNGETKLQAKNIEDLVQHLQVLSMLVYYPCEHIYWLGIHKILQVNNPDVWSRRSCQAWGVYIVLDLYTIVKQMVSLNQMLNAKKSEKSEDKDVLKLSGEMEDLKLRLITSCADLPMAIHWSLESYPLPPKLVALLGVISAVSNLKLKWKYL